jgi:hypothetical protein
VDASRKRGQREVKRKRGGEQQFGKGWGADGVSSVASMILMVRYLFATRGLQREGGRRETLGLKFPASVGRQSPRNLRFKESHSSKQGALVGKDSSEQSIN